MYGLLNFTLSFIVMAAVSVAIFIAERIWPGRELPHSKGWYLRAAIFNAWDVLVITMSGILIEEHFRIHSLLSLREWPVFFQTVFIWLVWSFAFYWWHRLVHKDGFWHVFHQMHHTPSRIEAITAFYKHPVEAIAETFITATIVYLICGASVEAGTWMGALVAMVGFFTHSNLRTPKWIGWVIQRPEQHSIHHQIDLHKYNYQDLIFWDRIFGTFKEGEKFERCGFPGENERRIKDILLFRDVYKS